MKRTLEDIRANLDFVGCDNETAREMCDEITRLRAELEIAQATEKGRRTDCDVLRAELAACQQERVDKAKALDMCTKRSTERDEARAELAACQDVLASLIAWRRNKWVTRSITVTGLPEGDLGEEAEKAREETSRVWAAAEAALRAAPAPVAVTEEEISSAVVRVWENEFNHLVGTPLFHETVRAVLTLLRKRAVTATTEDAVARAAAVIAASPLIDAPKLPAPCWHGLARAAIEAALTSAEGQS